MDELSTRGLTVTSLLNRSIHCLLDVLPYHLHEVQLLPPNLKDRLLYLLSTRGSLTDVYIRELVHNKVKRMELSDCDVTDDALEVVSSGCPSLQIIKMNAVREGRPAISTDGVLRLATGCRHLQVVSVLRCASLTDAAVVALAENCPRLAQLSVGGCQHVSDASLRALGQHSRFLNNLNVSKTNVTDDGICSLAAGVCANSLKELHISGCVAVTDESIEALIAFCPNLTYFLFHGCPKVTEAARDALSAQQAQLKHITWTIY